MKKVILMVALVCMAVWAGAQAKDTTLKQYVGKYTFPEGSFVTTAEISLEGDVLSVSSAQGGSPLEKKGKDTFAMVAYEGGMMYFSRNAEGKVARVKVEVDDILLDGTKDGVTVAVYRDRYFEERKRLQAR